MKYYPINVTSTQIQLNSDCKPNLKNNSNNSQTNNINNIFLI